MRLPLAARSVKRYQYTRAGLSPPTSTRQVQSDVSEIGASAVATVREKASSSATSTINLSVVLPPFGGRRVHSSTLWLSGSPEATPSGKQSRRSCQEMSERVAKDFPHAAVAPIATAISRNARLLRLSIEIVLPRGLTYVDHNEITGPWRMTFSMGLRDKPRLSEIRTGSCRKGNIPVSMCVWAISTCAFCS